MSNPVVIAAIVGTVGALVGGVIIALVNTFTTRDKYKAEVEHEEASAADLIQKASRATVADVISRLDEMEAELIAERKRSAHLQARVSSLEHNDVSNQAWIKNLEALHEKLQKEHRALLQQHNDLQRQYNSLEKEYMILSRTVEQSSSPDLRPAKDE